MPFTTKRFDEAKMPIKVVYHYLFDCYKKKNNSVKLGTPGNETLPEPSGISQPEKRNTKKKLKQKRKERERKNVRERERERETKKKRKEKLSNR